MEKNKKIEAAFSLDLSPQEVSFETGIPYDQVLDWMATEENMKKIEVLRLRPKWRAKKNILNKLDDDVKVAQWYLERKAKDEFSNRTELTAKDGENLIPQPLLFNVRSDDGLTESNGPQKEN